MNEYADHIIKAIRARQNAEKALWLENYVKHDIKSFGVGIPAIREIIKQFVKETQYDKTAVKDQIELLDNLMKDVYTEPKLAAILFIQLYWRTKNGGGILKIASDWFDNGWISDWNVCDWLCVRLLTPIVDGEPELAVSEFNKWNTSPNLWKARAALVPFAQSKNMANHTETILRFSTELIKREERFCKTAVGWALREYSKVDSELVINFLEEFGHFASKEVVNNATKYIVRK